LTNPLRYQRQIRWLVPFTAIRNGGKKRAIGLDEKLIQRKVMGNLKGVRGGIGNRTSDGKEEAQLNISFPKLPIAAKAMEHPQGLALRASCPLGEDAEHLFLGVTGVNDNR